MKFTVNVGKLLAAIDPCIDISLSSKNSIKDFIGLGKIYIKSNKDNEELYVKSFNGKIAIDGTLNNLMVDDLSLSVSEDGFITLDSKHLVSALESFNSEQSVVFNLVNKTDQSKELFIHDAADDTQYQTLTCFNDDVEIPSKIEDSEVENKFKIGRELFLSGQNKISFALCSDSQKVEFLYWVMRVKGDRIRFASGMGGMFAFYDVEGKNIIDSTKKDFNILFSSEYTPSMVKVLKEISDSSITVKESKSQPHKVSVSAGIYTLLLVGMDPPNDWINDVDLFNRDTSDCRFVVKAEDWEYACRGADATHTDEMKKEEKTHSVNLCFDSVKNVVEVKSENALKSIRKVKVSDFTTSCGLKEHNCSSYSKYVSSVLNFVKSGFIQFEFASKKDSTAKGGIVKVYCNASDKVADGSSLKSTNLASGVSEYSTVMFVQNFQ